MKFLLLVFFTSSLLSESMQYKDYDFNSTKREYLVYEPENFYKDSTKKLVIGFHGYSGTASAFESEITGGLNLIAEKYNFLAVYPQGKYFFDLETYTSKTFISSWNDLTGSVTKTPNGETCDIDADIYPKYPDCPDTGRCSWQTCADDIGFINSLIDFLKEKYEIDEIYLIGNSGGGMFVTAFACSYPEKISGVLSVNGMQAKDLACTPDRPVNAILYGSLKDTGVPPVDIRSDDGYFWEPLENTINSWAKKFKCNKVSENKFSFKENYVENTYSSCDQNKRVISILNLDAEHVWPETGYIDDTKSIYIPYGYCATDIQSYLGYQKCETINDNSVTEFLITKLFEFKI